MKMLHMIVSKIRMIMVDSPFVFIILCIGIISCNMMFIYTYGLIGETENDSVVADYFLYYNGNGNKESIEELKETLSALDCAYTADYLTIIDDASSRIGEDVPDTSAYMIRTREDITFFKVMTGNVRDLEESDTVLVPDKYQEAYNTSVLLNQAKLYVVGTTSTPYFISSMETYIQSGYTPDIVMLKILDKGKSLESMQNALGDAYDVEYYVNESIQEDVRAMRYEAYLLYILCAITFLFLCTYIYEDSAYELNVYQILGASRGNIICILSGAMFVILSGCSWITQCIHAIFYKAFFSRLFVNGGYTYSIVDYMKIYASSILLVFGFVFVYICLRTRKSTILNSRRMIK